MRVERRGQIFSKSLVRQAHHEGDLRGESTACLVPRVRTKRRPRSDLCTQIGCANENVSRQQGGRAGSRDAAPTGAAHLALGHEAYENQASAQTTVTEPTGQSWGGARPVPFPSRKCRITAGFQWCACGAAKGVFISRSGGCMEQPGLFSAGNVPPGIAILAAPNLYLD